MWAERVWETLPDTRKIVEDFAGDFGSEKENEIKFSAAAAPLGHILGDVISHFTNI